MNPAPNTTEKRARVLARAALAEIKLALPQDRMVGPEHLEQMRISITRALNDEIQARVLSENAIAAALHQTHTETVLADLAHAAVACTRASVELALAVTHCNPLLANPHPRPS